MNSDVQGYVAAALAALEAPSRYREAHAYILAHAGEALSVLLAALDGADECLACAAAQVLGTLDDADSIAAALSPLGHQALYGRASVATAAIGALTALPVTRAAVLTLEEALRSEHATVRLEAALGLARLGAQGARPLERRAATALRSLDPADVKGAVRASLSRLEPGARSVLIPVALSLDYEGALAALRDGLARRCTAVDAEEVLADRATVRAICSGLTPGNAAQAAPALAAAGAALRSSAANEPAAARAMEEAISALVTTLYAVRDPLERAPLLAALQSFGEPAERLLAERLADEEPAHVGALAQVLAEIGWQPGTDKAAARFWIARGRWEDALVAGPEAIAPLVEAFLSARGEPRRAAAEALERLNWTPTEDRLLVPFLIARDRWRALAALGPRAVLGLAAELEASRQEALAGAAPPDAVEVRVRIISLLAAADAAAAAVPLAAALAEDPSAAVRTEALHALRQGGRADAETLARALRAESAAVPGAPDTGREASAELRAEIIAAIGETGSPEVVELLMQALRTDPDPAARASAAAALAALHAREPEAVTAAAAALLDAGDGQAAGTLLARIDGPLVDRLVAQLGSSEPERVSQAIAALAAFARAGGDLNGALRKPFLEGSAEERLAAARVFDRVDALPTEAGVQAAYWLAKGCLDRCLALGAVAVPVLAAAIPRYEWRSAAAMTVALLQLRPEPEPPVVEEMIQRLGAIASLPSQAPVQIPPLGTVEPGARPTPVIVSHDEERSAARAYLSAIADLRRPRH